MSKTVISNYTFNAAAKTVTFSDFTNISTAYVYLITNVTTGTIIYQFNDHAKGGEAAGNVLTLTYDTTGMSNSDTLQIIYQTPTAEGSAPAGEQPLRVAGWDGTNLRTLKTDSSGNLVVQPGNSANSTPWLTSNTPVTTGGLTAYSYLSGASTNTTTIKASAGQIYAYQIFNNTSSARFVKIYNKATAPNLASDTPVKRLMIPAGGGVA